MIPAMDTSPLLVEPHIPEAEVSIYQKNGRATMIVFSVRHTGEELGATNTG